MSESHGIPTPGPSNITEGMIEAAANEIAYIQGVEVEDYHFIDARHALTAAREHDPLVDEVERLNRVCAAAIAYRNAYQQGQTDRVLKSTRSELDVSVAALGAKLGASIIETYPSHEKAVGAHLIRAISPEEVRRRDQELGLVRRPCTAAEQYRNRFIAWQLGLRVGHGTMYHVENTPPDDERRRSIREHPGTLV